MPTYAFKTHRKIDVYVDGEYSHSTNAYRTLWEAIAGSALARIATIGAQGLEHRPTRAGRITATFAKE